MLLSFTQTDTSGLLVAAQSAIVIGDVGALTEVIQRRLPGLAVVLSASCGQCVAADANVLAALGIRPVRNAVLPAILIVTVVVAVTVAIAIPIAIPVPVGTVPSIAVGAIVVAAVTVTAAAQPAIDVGDFSAILEVAQGSPVPLAVSSITIGLKPVSPDVNISAGLGVGPRRYAAISIDPVVVCAISVVGAIPVISVRPIALQRPVVVRNVAVTALKIRELSRLPVAVAILAGGVESRPIHPNIPAGLLIRARRKILRGAGGSHPESRGNDRNHREFNDVPHRCISFCRFAIASGDSDARLPMLAQARNRKRSPRPRASLRRKQRVLKSLKRLL